MTRFNHKFLAILIAAAALGVTAITTGTSAVAADGRVVRDHRTKPEVRDHRTKPEVRDHRKSGGGKDASDSPGGVRVEPGTSRCRAQVCATGNERPGRGRWPA
jgi:hypothetical protein